MTMIFIRYKSVSISDKSREHQKPTQSTSLAFKRFSESGELVFGFTLGHLKKIVAWTGPYRTGLNVYVGMSIYVCMYICTYVFVYVFTYANMYVDRSCELELYLLGYISQKLRSYCIPSAQVNLSINGIIASLSLQ